MYDIKVPKFVFDKVGINIPFKDHVGLKCVSLPTVMYKKVGKTGYFMKQQDNNDPEICTDFCDYLNIDGTEYYAEYHGNKGANSFLIILKESPDAEKPIRVLKASRENDRLLREQLRISPFNKQFYREIFALIECNENTKTESFVVKPICIGLLQCQMGTTHTYLPFYMMDYAECDLKKYIDNIKGEIPDSSKVEICYGLATAIRDLNNLGYYHRDIKPDNILMFGSKWLIGDLGLMAKRMDDYDKKGAFIGPKGWIAPEAMNKYLIENRQTRIDFDCNIDEQSDLFQLGKVFWYILQGTAPMGVVSREDYKGPYKDELFDMLSKMLMQNKQRRIKIDDVITVLKAIM